jgi:hypothetical protein
MKKTKNTTPAGGYVFIPSSFDGGKSRHEIISYREGKVYNLKKYTVHNIS